MNDNRSAEVLALKQESDGDIKLTLAEVTSAFGTVLEEFRGCQFIAGTGNGGLSPHDLDIVTMFSTPTAENGEIDLPQVADAFVASVEAMQVAIGAIQQEGWPVIAFSTVRNQDELTCIAEMVAGREPIGVHFLWYASPGQMCVAEPPMLARNLMEGTVLSDPSGVALVLKGRFRNASWGESVLPSSLGGLDQHLDTFRLAANIGGSLPHDFVGEKIGHNLERFFTWDVFAPKLEATGQGHFRNAKEVAIAMGELEESGIDPIVSLWRQAGCFRECSGELSPEDLLDALLRFSGEFIRQWDSINRWEPNTSATQDI